jgi:hypothetical protein
MGQMQNWRTASQPLPLHLLCFIRTPRSLPRNDDDICAEPASSSGVENERPAGERPLGQKQDTSNRLRGVTSSHCQAHLPAVVLAESLCREYGCSPIGPNAKQSHHFRAVRCSSVLNLLFRLIQGDVVGTGIIRLLCWKLVDYLGNLSGTIAHRQNWLRDVAFYLFEPDSLGGTIADGYR